MIDKNVIYGVNINNNIEILGKPLLVAKCTGPAAYRKIEIIGVSENGYY